VKSNEQESVIITDLFDLVIVFRCAIVVILLPHAYEELLQADHRLAFSVENGGTTLSFYILIFQFAIAVSEIVFTALILIGQSGRLAASLLSVLLCLHFIPFESPLVSPELFKHEIYVLLFPTLVLLIFTGSGNYSIDRWRMKHKAKHT
jgi:uncharacterized membrane protein YphA (DoxX/SURF4 family)